MSSTMWFCNFGSFTSVNPREIQENFRVQESFKVIDRDNVQLIWVYLTHCVILVFV